MLAEEVMTERTPLRLLGEAISTDNHGDAQWAAILDIYETGHTYPVVRHIFFGRTRKEAEHYHESHLKTDSFMRSCEQKKKFDTFRCRTTWKVVKL